MDTQDRRPAWWQLLLLLPVMIGLVVLEARAPCSEPVHTAATVGILLLTYALVGLWVRANRLPLLRANHLVTLVRRSQERVVRGELGEECHWRLGRAATTTRSPARARSSARFADLWR